MQHLQNRASSHAGQGHKISMAILDRGSPALDNLMTQVRILRRQEFTMQINILLIKLQLRLLRFKIFL